MTLAVVSWFCGATYQTHSSVRINVLQHTPRESLPGDQTDQEIREENGDQSSNSGTSARK